MNDHERAAFHQDNLSQQSDKAAEVLRYISEIDDLPIEADDPVMGQLVSKLTSTANLTAEQVRSNEWVREYLLILYLARRPRKEGVHSGWRAWSHDDHTEDIEPLDPEERLQIETSVSMTKLALTRSEDMEGVKESTRNRSESYVHEDGDGGGKGGILGKIKP